MQAPQVSRSVFIVLLSEALSEPTAPLIQFSEAAMRDLADAAFSADTETRRRMLRQIPGLRPYLADRQAQANRDGAADALSERWHAAYAKLNWNYEAGLRRDAARKRAEEMRPARERAHRILPRVREIDALPPRHRDALLRLARVDGDWGAVTRGLSSGRDGTPASVLAACEIAERAVAVLDAIEPPPTECSREGRLLAQGREDEIRDAADKAAKRWDGWFRDQHDHVAVGFDVPLNGLRDDGTEREDWERRQLCDERWHRRRLRRESLRAQSYYDTALRMARPARPFISEYSLTHWEERQRRAADWARATTVRFSDSDDDVALAEILKNSRRARRAQTWATMKGIEVAASRLGWIATFATITLPGEYHSYVSGPRGRDGTYPNQHANENWTPQSGPVAAALKLQEIWTRFRARLAKLPELRGWLGISVPEPHKSGTPHLHAMLYVPPYVMRNGRRRRTENVLRRELAEVTDGPRQTKLILVAGGQGEDGERRATPASYVMKYVMKSLASPDDDEADAADPDVAEVDEIVEQPNREAGDAHRAWLQQKGRRGYRLHGVHGLVRVVRRLYGLKENEESGPQAAAVAGHLRAVRGWNLAAQQSEDAENRARCRQQASDEFCNALVAAGAIPALVPRARLRLHYERGETEHGKPTRRAYAIAETVRKQVSQARARSECLEWGLKHVEYDDRGRIVSIEDVEVPEPTRRWYSATELTYLQPMVPERVTADGEAIPAHRRFATLRTVRPLPPQRPVVHPPAGAVTVVAMYPRHEPAARATNENQAAGATGDNGLASLRPPDRQRRGGLVL